ncbi:hypothetical protein ACOMHN_058287 [Nucella lapillus]
MAKMLLLTLMVGAVLLLETTSHASVLKPDPSTKTASGSGGEDLLNIFTTAGPASEDDDTIVEEIVDELADDSIVKEVVDELADDDMVEKELTEDEKDLGDPVEFPLKDMDDEELKEYLKLEDQIFLGEADEHVAFQLLKEKRALHTKGGNLLRRKRIAPLVARAAFAVARGLARRFARSGVTRSGSRVTRHYNGRGSYGDAVRDFNRMRPNNVRGFDNGRISGQTGTIGRHRVTVRNGSSGNSRPTLEVRSHGGSMVRKFRYNRD